MFNEEKLDFDFDTARQRILDLPEVNAAARAGVVEPTLLDDIVNLLVVEDADVYDGQVERLENENEILEIQQQHNVSLFQNFGISLVFFIIGLAIKVSPLATALFIAIALYFFVMTLQQMRFFQKYKSAVIEHDKLIQSQAKKSRMVKFAFRQYLSDVVEKNEHHLPDVLARRLNEFHETFGSPAAG